MICKNQCADFRKFRDDLGQGDARHSFDAEEAVDVLVRLTEKSEKSGGLTGNPEVLEEIIGFEQGYVNILFDVCEARGTTGLRVLGAVLRAASTQDCGRCPFVDLCVPEYTDVQQKGATDGRS